MSAVEPPRGSAASRSAARPRSAATGGASCTLTWTLAVLEFRLRFFGSVLGYFWQLMRPLLLFGVLYFVFTQSCRFGGGVKYYPVDAADRRSSSTRSSPRRRATPSASVIDRENLVRKIQFPRLVIPLSVVLTRVLNLAPQLRRGRRLRARAGRAAARGRWFVDRPAHRRCSACSCTGIAMLLSALYVRYRDVQPIWDVGSRCSSTRRRSSIRSRAIPSETLAAPDHVQPARGRSSSRRATRSSTRRRPAPPRRSAAPGRAARSRSRSWSRSASLGYWIFDRSAPHDRRGAVTCAPAGSSPRRSCRTRASWRTRSARRR